MRQHARLRFVQRLHRTGRRLLMVTINKGWRVLKNGRQRLEPSGPDVRRLVLVERPELCVLHDQRIPVGRFGQLLGRHLAQILRVAFQAAGDDARVLGLALFRRQRSAGEIRAMDEINRKRLDLCMLCNRFELKLLLFMIYYSEFIYF